MGGRVRAGIGVVVAAVLVAAGTTGCAEDRSDQLSTEAPTYVPTSLPGGFGANDLDYRPGADSYTLTARAHDTTYTVRVRNRLDGDSAVDPAAADRSPAPGDVTGRWIHGVDRPGR